MLLKRTEMQHSQFRIFAGVHVVNGRPTAGAKIFSGSGGDLVSRQSAFWLYMEVSKRDYHVGREGTAIYLAAHVAVAINNAFRGPVDDVSDRAALASSS